MGNRAVVTFDKNPTEKSVGVYLHWNGGEESILGFLQACDKYDVRDDNDSAYQLARFVQIIGNFFGGTCSVGVATLDQLDCENHDNGLFIVGRNGAITMKNSGNGKLSGPFEELDLDRIRKGKYFKGEHNIMSAIAKKNDAAFKE